MPEEEMSLYFVELLSSDREAVEKDHAENPAPAEKPTKQ